MKEVITLEQFMNIFMEVFQEELKAEFKKGFSKYRLFVELFDNLQDLVIQDMEHRMFLKLQPTTYPRYYFKTNLSIMDLYNIHFKK